MAECHVIKIGDAMVGGPFGSTTGLVVGSIFYDKHSIVSDPFAGEFDQSRAAELVDRVNQLSKRYGVQMAFDIIAASPEAMERFLEFVSARTNLPLLINATEAETRIAGLEAAAKLGILNRSIYASLNEDTEDEELEALGRHRPAAVMILASDVSNPTPEGTCEMIENYYHPMLKEIGVQAPIVDVGTMDPPSIGLNIRQIQAVRERFGYPAGCAFSNCFPQWTSVKKLGREWVNLSLATALAVCRAAGADYLHYGIIEKAAVAVYVSGTAEVFYGFAAKELDGQKLPENHPLWNMFKL
ncbi:tetrahydromethanopterin S-methyltransferase subunit H family protein [Thermosediminibacter oceani]|uniref:Tetrahydromethanopterin S-methyltransferase n=1 Tax=Thermosediminibacter oceani (strain ATCC BAA-1034 / DSM 16646 / JW/IW-1228P) TaxID=555079 RepID=D9RY56_THEOJ|nr:tetrahydromethanopterin S-methyltransferase subunit H [Thermosediminibacter oceani]ADL08280.1 Tetrahydromethanopterin S-methyltransferase [Thermosediminibacter oceani DSM 16646]